MANPHIAKIRAAAARYPEAERAFLFGDHEVFRVKKKVFLWLGDDDDAETYVGVKLKATQAMALSLPFVKPMEYGMAKWGWIGATFPKGKPVPLELVLAWLDESYRGTAPAKLVKQLDGGATATKAPARKPSAKVKPRARSRRAAAR